MNKKRMSAAIAALLTAGTVFAETPVGKTVDEAIDDCFEVIFDFEFLDEENPEDSIEEVIIDDSGIAMEDEEVTAGNEEKNTEMELDTELAAVAEVMSAEDSENYLVNLKKVVEFKEKYNMSPDEKAQFDKWIIEGKNPQLLMYIYQFWITTDEDISIIEDVYNMFVENYEEDMRLPQNKDLWFEGIFNNLTGGKYGRLTSDEIDEYLQNGMSIEDIEIAEYLSRRGTDVHDIIADKASDKEWSEIAADICEIPALAQAKEMEVDTLLDIITLSRISDADIAEVINNLDNIPADEALSSAFDEGKKRAENIITANEYLFAENTDMNASDASAEQGEEHVDFVDQVL